MLSLCCLGSYMLSVASIYLGRVDASDSKREYLCSIVGFMPLVIWESDRNLYGFRCVVATREKTTFLCSRTFALFILRTLLKAIICCSQLNIRWLLGRHPEGGLLVIDAVGLQSMYFVVMPKVNLIVILMTYVCYLYSINFPTVICLSSMLLFILWRDTTSELSTPVQFPLHCYTVYFTRLFTFLHTITFYHSIRLILCLQQISEIDNLIVSWGKVLGCVVCRFHVAAGAKQSPGRGAI
jgi:hypothetical protein